MKKPDIIEVIEQRRKIKILIIHIMRIIIPKLPFSFQYWLGTKLFGQQYQEMVAEKFLLNLCWHNRKNEICHQIIKKYNKKIA